MTTDSMKQMLTCPIHLGQLNDPILLQCQHAYCRVCIVKCVKNANITACPLCRTKIDYTIDDFLTMNASLIHKQLVETCSRNREIYKKTMKLKVSLLGSSGAGKSTIMRYLAGFPHADDIASTVGVDTVVIDVDNKDYLIKVYLWDTAGQEIFRTIIKSYYRNSKGIILVFDVTEARTFQDVEIWLNEIKVNCRDEDLVIALVANKIDLVEKRKVSIEQAKKLADRYNLLYFETSAKTGENTREMLNRLVSKITSIMELTNDNQVINTSTINLRASNYSAGKLQSSKTCSC
jgi:small GTP-binding protein